MITYSYQRSGMQLWFRVQLHRDEEIVQGRFEQRGHSCLAGVVSLLVFGLVLAGLVCGAMAASAVLGVAHPFDMDRRSLWIVGISMISVALFSLYLAAVAGKFIDPQRFRMSFADHDSLNFEVVARAATGLGVNRYTVLDHHRNCLGELQQQQYSGRIQLMASAEPCVVVTFPDDTPTLTDLLTPSSNRPGFWPAVRLGLMVVVVMPLMMLAPIWISITRPLPADARRRTIWVIDSRNPSQLQLAGELFLETQKTYLLAATLRIAPPGESQHKLIAAAVAVLFEGVLTRPEA